MAICVSGQCQKHGPSLADDITNWLWRFSGDPPLPPPSSSRTLFRSHRRLPPPATAAAVIVVTAITIILPSVIAVAGVVLVSLPPPPLRLLLPILVDCWNNGGQLRALNDREKANLLYIHSRSASRTSMLITNFIMVPILQKRFVWRPCIICDKIFLNGTIFLYWAQTKHIFLNETVFLY